MRNQHQVYAWIPMSPPLILSSSSTWFFLFLSDHLPPIGFLPDCSTFAFDRINQYLCCKKSFISKIANFFHHSFSVPFNASSIPFGVFKPPLNSSEFKENIISSCNSCSYASNNLGKCIRLRLIVSSLKKFFLSCTTRTRLIRWS